MTSLSADYSPGERTPATRRYWYFVVTGWRDTLRALGPLLANVLIVAGICLPILLLLGLKRGLIEQFRQDLLKSPTAREIQVYVVKEGTGLSVSRERTIETLAGVSIVIPDIPGSVWLSRPGTAQGGEGEVEASLSATKPGNPILAFYGADVLARGERGIMLSTALADSLKVRYRRVSEKRIELEPPGTPLTLGVARGGESKRHTFGVQVKGIFEGTGRTGFMDRQLMEWLEDFKKGRSVEALALPGAERPPQPRFDGYLAFTKVAYGGADLEGLKRRGLSATEIDDPPGSERGQWKQLYGLLKLHSIHVYWVRAGLSTGGGKGTVELPPAEVEDITDADDVVMPWSEPQVLTLDGRPHRVVGVSVQGRWLRQHFRNPLTRLDPTKDEMRVMFPPPPAPIPATLPAPAGPSVPPPPATEPATSPATVPVPTTEPAPTTQPPVATQPAPTTEPSPTTEPTLATQPAVATLPAATTKPSPTTEPAPAASPATAPATQPATGPTTEATPTATPPVSAATSAATSPASPPTVRLELPGGRVATLAIEPLAAGPAEGPSPAGAAAPSPPLAIVSSTLMAYLGRAREGSVRYDAVLNRFVPTAGENEYTRARVYATDLETVPDVDEKLRALGYTTTSNRTRVLEIKNYASTLEIIVRTVLYGVFLFGLLTVLFVFNDLTNRKRGAIGIMRIMGMPKIGILLVVIVRALLVSALGAVTTIVLGSLIAVLLTRVFHLADCDLRAEDMYAVIILAVAFSVLGVLIPAWRAAYRLDPVDAIYGAKVQ